MLRNETTDWGSKQTLHLRGRPAGEQPAHTAESVHIDRHKNIYSKIKWNKDISLWMLTNLGSSHTLPVTLATNQPECFEQIIHPLYKILVMNVENCPLILTSIAWAEKIGYMQLWFESFLALTAHSAYKNFLLKLSKYHQKMRWSEVSETSAQTCVCMLTMTASLLNLVIIHSHPSRTG